MRKIALLFTLVVIAMLVVNVDLMAQDAVAAPSTGFQMLKEKFIEGLKDYVIIKTDSGRIITLQTMKSLEEKLPTPNFMRIHRSYIVNLEKISAVVGNMVEVIEKGQPKLLPIGKNYREELERVVEKNRL